MDASESSFPVQFEGLAEIAASVRSAYGSYPTTQKTVGAHLRISVELICGARVLSWGMPAIVPSERNDSAMPRTIVAKLGLKIFQSRNAGCVLLPLSAQVCWGRPTLVVE